MRAAIDMTFAKGPVVAAKSGIAVEANHQSCGWSSSSGLMPKLHPLGAFLGENSILLTFSSGAGGGEVTRSVFSALPGGVIGSVMLLIVGGLDYGYLIVHDHQC